ncbi:hypothetical protein ACN3E9_04170 [Vibrio pectenicida]|uniref:hypothetical protein n=1 Tax=Vibrio pectenicida TaxID=62763 RepID=UPI003B9C2154
MTAIKISSPIIAGAALKSEIVKINFNKSVRSVNHRSDKRDEHNIGHLNDLKNGPQVSMSGGFKSGTRDKNSPQAPMNSFGKSNNIQNKPLVSMYGNLEPVTRDQDSFGFLNTPKGGAPVSMYGDLESVPRDKDSIDSLRDLKKDLKSSYLNARDKKEESIYRKQLKEVDSKIQKHYPWIVEKEKKAEKKAENEAKLDSKIAKAEKKAEVPQSQNEMTRYFERQSSTEAKKSKNYNLAESIIRAKHDKYQNGEHSIRHLNELKQKLKEQYEETTSKREEKSLLKEVKKLDAEIAIAEKKDKKYTKQLNNINKKMLDEADKAIKLALVGAHVQVKSNDESKSISPFEMHIASIAEDKLDDLINNNIPSAGDDEDKKDERKALRKTIRKAFYEQTKIEGGSSASRIFQQVRQDIEKNIKGGIHPDQVSVIEEKLNGKINHMIQTDRTGVLSKLKTTHEINIIINELKNKYFPV